MFQKISLIKKSPNYLKERVYLLDKKTDANGFFLFNGMLTFAQKVDYSKESILSTEYLDYYPSLNVKSIENDSSFEEGFYDFLYLKSEDADLMINFITLCNAYLKDSTVSFGEFIRGMIELFQLPKRESKLNTIGLFGELSLIKNTYINHLVDLTKGWHLSGAYSRYDFSFGNNNLEVKTTTNDSTNYLIKHSQLFNGGNNYICLIRIEKVDSGGDSLKDLIYEMQNSSPFCNNIKFQIALSKELKKTFDSDTLNERFVFKDAFFFHNSKLETIKNIPSCISEIEYRYDFDVSESVDEKVFLTDVFKK